MPHVDLHHSVPCPQTAIAPRVLTVLEGYASRNDVALTVDLGIGGAAVSVPVDVALADAGARTASAIPITLKAMQRSAWFPVFRGEVRSEPGGPLESSLHLNGSYDAPLGALGDIADRTVLGHAAERSLESFLERLRNDVLAEVRRAELAIRLSGRRT